MKIEDIKEIIDWHKIWAENSNNFEYDYQYKQELEISKAITELYNKYIDLLNAYPSYITLDEKNIKDLRDIIKTGLYEPKDIYDEPIYSKYYYGGSNYYKGTYDENNIVKATTRPISGTPVYDFLNELSLKCEEEMKDVVVINKTPQKIEECLKTINKQAKEILNSKENK